MALGNGRQTAVTVAPQPGSMSVEELRVARQDHETHVRRRDLTVPLSPRLVVPSPTRWANIPDVHRVFIPVPQDAAPITDMERLDALSRNSDLTMKVTKPQANGFLEEANVVFDERTKHWEHVDGRGYMSPINSPLDFYRIKGLVEIVTHGTPRYQGSLIATMSAVEGRATEEVDPQEYLAQYRGDVRSPRGTAVLGTDRDTGEVRVDIASIPAVRHFFELD